MVGTWLWRLLACVTEVYTLLNVCMSDNRKLVDRLGDYVNSLWVKRGRSKVSGLSTYCLLSLAPVVFGYVWTLRFFVVHGQSGRSAPETSF